MEFKGIWMEWNGILEWNEIKLYILGKVEMKMS